MTTTTGGDATPSATHSIEIELTFDVDASTPLPDLTSAPGVVRMGKPEHRPLDAVYLDTTDLVLARAAVALRRRTGGPDAGWHLKTTAPEGRHEYGWPLDDGSGEPDLIVVPSGVRAAVDPWVAEEPLRAIARVRNARTAYALTDAAGGVIAEFTDDQVEATDLLRGVTTVWREWEVELGPARPTSPEAIAAFFSAVDEAVRAVGARPPSSGSKLQRALGR